MYVATGIMNSCVYYVSALFPMEYINAIILGNNFAGIFTSVASILSKATSPNLRIAAIYYFLAAFVVLMFAFVGYFLMHRTKFYRYYMERSEAAQKKAMMESSNDQQRQKVPYFQIIKKVNLNKTKKLKTNLLNSIAILFSSRSGSCSFVFGSTFSARSPSFPTFSCSSNPPTRTFSYRTITTKTSSSSWPSTCSSRSATCCPNSFASLDHASCLFQSSLGPFCRSFFSLSATSNPRSAASFPSCSATTLSTGLVVLSSPSSSATSLVYLWCTHLSKSIF